MVHARDADYVSAEERSPPLGAGPPARDLHPWLFLCSHTCESVCVCVCARARAGNCALAPKGMTGGGGVDAEAARPGIYSQTSKRKEVAAKIAWVGWGVENIKGRTGLLVWG